MFWLKSTDFTSMIDWLKATKTSKKRPQNLLEMLQFVKKKLCLIYVYVIASACSDGDQ